MATTQPLTQTLFDPHLPGTYGCAPVQWLYHRVSHVSSSAQDLKNEGWFEQLYQVCEKVVRVFYAILIVPALIPAAIGLIYNFYVVMYKPPSNPTDPEAEAKNKLIQELHQLHKVYEKTFDNLRQVSGVQLLQQQFTELEAAFDPYKEQLPRSYADLKWLKTQLALVREKQVELVYTPLRITDEGVIPVPDRGNCFYEAAARAFVAYNLEEAGGSGFIIPIDAKELRDQIIEWEMQYYVSDEKLRGYIEVAIGTYLADKDKEIEDEQQTIALLELEGYSTEAPKERLNQLEKILEPFRLEGTRVAHYFERAKAEGFWAMTPEFYALSQLYNVEVTVRRKNQGVELEENGERFEQPNPTEPKRQMTIWYIDNHHFELQLEKL